MKIKRKRLGSLEGLMPYEVTGPEYERKFPTEGSAVARALDLALDTGSTHYIREHGDVIAWAEGEKGQWAQAYYRREAAA